MPVTIQINESDWHEVVNIVYRANNKWHTIKETEERKAMPDKAAVILKVLINIADAYAMSNTRYAHVLADQISEAYEQGYAAGVHAVVANRSEKAQAPA